MFSALHSIDLIQIADKTFSLGNASNYGGGRLLGAALGDLREAVVCFAPSVSILRGSFNAIPSEDRRIKFDTVNDFVPASRPDICGLLSS
jgi:hypothetical protein